MPDPIVHKETPLSLLGGSDVSPTVLKICLSRASQFVAADGGGDLALRHNLRPLAVIGDLDSISHAGRTAFASVLHAVDDTDTTDFEKVLQRVSAPLMLAAGFLGGRLDHTLSVLNTLVRYPESRVILLSDDDAVVLISAPTKLKLEVGTRLALLPMGDASVSTSGLKWNLTNAAMHPTGLISPSNAVAEQQVEITPIGPVFLTVPLTALDAVIDAVLVQ